MASLVNRNGTFYVCWTDTDRSPSQRRLSLRTRDKGLARILMGKADAAYRMGQFDPWLDGLEALDPTRPETSVLLAEAQRRYLAARGDDLRPLTIKRYLAVFKGLGKHLKQNAAVARVRSADLAPYVLDPNAMPNTQRCRRTLLRAFFAWCEKEGLAQSNPAATLRQPKHDVGKSVINRRVTEEELERICAEVEKDHERRMSLSNRHLGVPRLWLARVFRFAYCTGLRGGV